MLRGILGRVLGGGRRGAGTPGMAGGRARGTGAGNADLARGARSLFRGLSRRRGV